MTVKRIKIRSTLALRIALWAAAALIVGGVTLFILAIYQKPDIRFLLGFQILSALFLTFLLALILLVLASILKLQEAQARQNEHLLIQQRELTEELLQQRQNQSAIPQPAQTQESVVAQKSQSFKAADPIPEGSQVLPDLYPLLDALHELRDVMLMSDEDRRQLRLRQEEERRQALLATIRLAIEQHGWELATQRISELAADDPARAELSQKMNELREKIRTQAIKDAREQLHHLMSIANWMRADEVIAELTKQFPDDVEVRELAAQVHQEKDTFIREQTTTMLADLKAATDRKDWRRALLLAEELVARYPDLPAIARLQSDMPTLRENADAQERREEETLFKELLLSQRYDEALEVARRVMDRFPGSPTAIELEKLLPKVKELAEKKN